MKQYNIAGTNLAITVENKLEMPHNMGKFESKEDGVPCMIYDMQVGRLEPDLLQNYPFIRREKMYVYEEQGREIRVLTMGNDSKPYAMYEEVSETQVRIKIEHHIQDYCNCDAVFLSMLALERRMIRDNGLVFHCANLCYEGASMLFSGPSGIGKSTLSNRWKEMLGGTVINGDRALLKQENGAYMVYGFPLCGSSNICHNEVHPLRCIVMLKQGKQNVMKRLEGMVAVKKVIQQTIINYWNPQFVERAYDLVEELVRGSVVYEYECVEGGSAVVELVESMR